MKTLEQLAVEHQEFSVSTFEGETPLTALLKLKEEIKEVESDIANGNIYGLPEEYADCLMCIFSSAARAGVTIGQIVDIFEVKLLKNKARTWIKNPDGTYSHAKTTTNTNGEKL